MKNPQKDQAQHQHQQKHQQKILNYFAETHLMETKRKHKNNGKTLKKASLKLFIFVLSVLLLLLYYHKYHNRQTHKETNKPYCYSCIGM